MVWYGNSATWSQPGLSFVNEIYLGFTQQTETKAGYRGGVPPPKNVPTMHILPTDYFDGFVIYLISIW